MRASTPASTGYALDTFQVITPSDLDEHFREITAMVESGLVSAKCSQKNFKLN